MWFFDDFYIIVPFLDKYHTTSKQILRAPTGYMHFFAASCFDHNLRSGWWAGLVETAPSWSTLVRLLFPALAPSGARGQLEMMIWILQKKYEQTSQSVEGKRLAS